VKSISVDELAAKSAAHLLNSIVIPRPIAWVSSIDAAGTANLAPHSYFNAVSADPPIVMFASAHSSQLDPRGRKDTLRNIEATREFVVQIVSEEMIGPMNRTAAEVPSATDEFELAGLDKCRSMRVRPPRIAGIGAALECRLNRLLDVGDATVVFGDVLVIHVEESLLQEGRVDPDRLRPLGRLGGSNYAGLGQIISLRRP